MTRFIAQTVAVVAAASFACTAAAQNLTLFTFQGELKDNGSLANGSYDMEFSLWDALNGGGQVASTVTRLGVPVSDGRFTVNLDFGADAFDNDTRWLQIDVNGMPLSPRQPIWRVPYSIQTRGIFVSNAGNTGMGTTSPDGPLHVLESSAGAVTAQAESIAVFERVGDGFISILTPDDRERGILFGDPESNVNGGIVYNSPSIPDGFGFRTGGNSTRMVIDAVGNVGIGTTVPDYPLQIETNNASRAIQAYSTATSGLTYGAICRSDSTNGRGVFGWGAANSGTNFGVYGRSDSPSGTGVYGVSGMSSGTSYGVTGFSISADGFDFFAAGSGEDYGSSSSIRWKRNVAPIDDPLYMLSKLRGVYFDWDDEHGGHHDVGMIAEEVGEVLPEIVVYEPNGIDAIGMDYSKLTPLLVEAVKALHESLSGRVIAQTNRIASLEAENTELRERLALLEAAVERLAAQE